MSYDHKCHELALHFLDDFPPPPDQPYVDRVVWAAKRRDVVAAIAQAVQDAVEAELANAGLTTP